MKLDYRSFFITPFQKNIATLFSGTFLAQVISVIGALILAKIYAPERYGAYSVFLSLVGILTVINSLKLDYIVVTDKSDKRSVNMVNSILIIILVTSTLILGLFTSIKSFFFEHGITFFVLIFSVISSLFLSNSKLLESYATRVSWFKSIARARVILSICTVLFQFSLFHYSKHGLIYGYMIAVIILFIFYIFISKGILKSPDIGLFKTTLKNHKNLLNFALPSGTINAIALYILPILLLSYFSAADAGVYALSLKVVSVPMFLISSSVSQVYFQKASQFFNHSKNKLFDFTKKVTSINVLIIIATLFLINTLGIYLLELFFDKDWEHLRTYILMLSFLVICQTAFSPISSIIVIIHKNHIGLVFNIVLALLNFIAIYIGNLYENITYTVLFYSISAGMAYLMLLYYFLSVLKIYKNGQ